MEKQALNGPPLVTFERVPALDVKKLLRHVPGPPTLTYVLLTYVLEMPDTNTNKNNPNQKQGWGEQQQQQQY